MTIVEAIRAVTSGTHLTLDQAHGVFSEIMEGKATDAQIAALIVALRMKGEAVEEIAGAAMAMRERAAPVAPADSEHCVDTCGTGGDRSNTFNISTTVAFVAAGAGARVAKHGNRAVSSRSGSADVLEALGVKIDLAPAAMKQCLDESGICFLFAPQLHKAMKYAAGPRKEIGVRTIFNILGPLTNPASAPAQVLGVFSPDLTETMAGVLLRLGTKKAYVVHGLDGLDEVSIAGPTRVTEAAVGATKTYEVSPSDFGLPTAALSEVAGGTAAENAEITRSILTGAKGPKRDIVLLNSAFAIAAAGLAATPRDALPLAARSIDSGAALHKLHMLASKSTSL